MGETGAKQGLETQGRSSGQGKPVDLYSKGREPVATGHVSKHGHTYVVHAASGTERVLLQVDTTRLVERNRIKAANDSVRRRTRG